MYFTVSFFRILFIINTVIVTVFSICYANQLVHILGSIFLKKKRYPVSKTQHRYGFLIAARNEEKVIGDLVRSIRAQEYPQELIHIFVVADNCKDATAAVAREAGAIVFERFNQQLRGKGYAMDDAFKRIMTEYADLSLEAFFIFDADNLLHPRFTAEMNNAFDSGCQIITGYRSTNNFAESWLSGGSSFMYLRESRQIHRSRAGLGIGTYVSGTGYLISAEYIRKFGGWPYHTLVEDVEVSTITTTQGDQVAFVEDAVFYDNQPTRFKDFWRQRIRWCRGNHQIFFRYGIDLWKSLLKKPSLTKWEMLMHILPAPAFTFMWFGLYTILALAGYVILGVSGGVFFREALVFCLANFLGPYIMGFLDGFLLMIQCFRELDAPARLKWKYMLLFPVAMYMFVPITVLALFIKVEWAPIRHTRTAS